MTRLRQLLTKASFASGADRQAAIDCVDKMEQAMTRLRERAKNDVDVQRSIFPSRPNAEAETLARSDNSSPPSCSAFVRVGDAGGNDERFVRTVSDNVWVSVLHRLTGFGWWEWETAICTKEPRTCNIVIGDRRTELESLPEDAVLAWYEDHKAEKNSMEAVLDALKPDAVNHQQEEVT